MLPSPSSTVTVVIDGYTHNSILTSRDSVPLGTQIILVCRVVGLPYGIPLNYTWTCSSGRCKVEGDYGGKVYNEHILAVSTTSTLVGGAYTCQVTATGGQEATGTFTFTVTGMCVCLALYCSSNGTDTSLVLHTHSGGSVVHSDHRIIPHQFLITSEQKISNLTGKWPRQLPIYGITCTVSSGTPPPRFYSPNGTLDTGAVTQQSAHSITLQWDDANIETLQSRNMYCMTLYMCAPFPRYCSYNHRSLPPHPVTAPGVTITRVTSSQVEYETTAHGSATRVIAGYEVTRFAFHYEQHAEDVHYENIDIGEQGCRGREEGNGIRSEESHYDVVVAADNVPLNGRAGHGSSKEVQVQQDDQSTRDTPDAVYAVVA